MKVWGVSEDGQRTGLGFDCPGCGLVHIVWTAASKPVRWEWNGSMESPTFSPSLLVTCQWGDPPSGIRCHSFVQSGRIEFLSDCTHALRGQTVELPEVPDGKEYT